jgi:hypothetical protein
MASVAEIIAIEATPSPAPLGQPVTVRVSVKNLGLAPAGYNYIALTGAFDSTELSFIPDYQYADAQATVDFTASFTMPAEKVRVTVYSWYWDFNRNTWASDDQRFTDVEASTFAGWLQVAAASLSVSRVVAYAGWLQVAVTNFSIMRAAAPVIAGWVNVAMRSLKVNRPAVPVPRKETAFPWGWVALGGAGLVALVALAPKEKAST